MTTLITGISYGHSLAVGLDRIFWVEGNNIRRADASGASQMTLIYFPYTYGTARSVCVDAANSALYFAALPNYPGNGGIMRCDALGNSGESWVIKGSPSGHEAAWFLAMDAAMGMLYSLQTFQEYDPVQPHAARAYYYTSSIAWMSTAAFAAHPVNSMPGRCGGVAVDAGLSAGARYVYWTDTDAGRIGRCKVDGTGATWLITGLDTPKGIAVDIRGGKLYWSDASGIHRASLDGSGQGLVYPNVHAVALALG